MSYPIELGRTYTARVRPSNNDFVISDENTSRLAGLQFPCCVAKLFFSICQAKDLDNNRQPPAGSKLNQPGRRKLSLPPPSKFKQRAPFHFEFGFPLKFHCNSQHLSSARRCERLVVVIFHRTLIGGFFPPHTSQLNFFNTLIGGIFPLHTNRRNFSIAH